MPPGSTCRFKMNTLNIIDYSETYSKVLSVLFAQLPDQPPIPTYVNRHGGNTLISLPASITIAWEPPTEKGGLPILGYLVHLSHDDGTTWLLAFDGSVKPAIT